ncbi:ubiquitin conjugating enzyme 7 interacting protein [Culex quinquefasciatus]|uniref:RanBP-type and C3HC4-type zinc finger-containing protein 1 n=1 Tax=Culex quinquefasciatus TaxID=7176 RepID=B0WCQ8_CULQU|nr:ubiquitin conjugating enzyme 7 interacting protein [Culex quinquefasciatus]|eukprot:XP_001846492.1 ubiquitin conjugating enzyme 7 interacting protein [Culex quinquefasciatus]
MFPTPGRLRPEVDQRDPDLELPQVVDLRQPQPVQAEPSTPAAVACASNPQVASETSSDEVSQSNGTHSSSPSPSPVIDCNNLSKASSCDSILSTATTGFAFVPPNCYDEVIGRLPQTERVINPGPYTDSYKRRVRQLDQTREQDKKNDLTLRKKYNLFSSIRSAAPKPPERDATLTRHNQKPTYPDLSLPSTSKVTAEANKNDDPTDSTVKRHRRTVSDSSKDRKAGAYVHVRGKRRAPPPPPLDLNANSQGTLSNQSQSSYGTLSPGSTLSRKKRPAPLPPPRSPTSPTLNEAVSNTSLLEDKEIKAIIEGTSRPKSPTFIMPIRTTPLPGISEERTPGGLTEEQKQQLIDNIRRVQTPEADPPTPTNAPSPSFMLTNNDVMKLEENFINTNGTRSPIHDYLYAEAVNSNVKPGIPTSPISPRPWYKRPISGTKQQESSLPFKKDIILKTIDKRKAKQRDKEDLPEVGYCRNSLVDTGSTSHSATKFNLFAKITEKSDDTKRRERDNEKRKSGIGIPSISELDREAAEIINKENALKQTHQAAESDLYFSAPEQLVKRSRSFVSKDEPESIDQASGNPKSTKELISRFEATSTNISKSDGESILYPKKKTTFGEPRNTQPTPPDSKENTPPQGIVKTGSDKNLLGLWSCPYCTLENPNWRIICEACERIKPYEKLSILEEPPLRPNHPLKKAIPEVKAPPQQPTAEDWDKKTERVLKYFMPKTNPTMGSGGTPESPKKSFGQAKMLASPKMGVKSLMNRMSPDKPNGFRNFNANPEAYHATNKFDDEKLKENAVVVTTVPTVIAPLASPEPTVEGVPTSQIDLDEVRNARIARFSTNLDKNDDEPPKHVQDMDDEALEKEKERLREMIRAMNAKALADKYPVLQKPPSSGPAKRESPLMQRRNVFISGIPVSTNSPKPIRKASPTMAKKAAPIVEEHPPIVAEPYKLGAIKKTFVRKTEEPKIINQEVKSPAREQNLSPKTIPKTVTELNEPKLVLTNDVQRIRYEVMDEEQFKQQNPAPRHDSLTRQAPFSDQQNEKVRQISHQLRSAQGVQHFKNTLKYAGTSMTRTNTLAINKLLRNLELAIGEGAHDKAARLAMDLAKMKVSLSVTRQSPGGSDSGSSGSLTETSVTVYINDKNSRKGPLKVSVSSTLTLAQWKLKFARDYGIPLAIQRWVCNDLYLSNERKTLYDYGVDSEHVLQLYIVSEAVKPLKPLGTTVAAASVVKVEEKVVPVMTVVKPQFSKTEAKILSVSDSDGDGSDTQNEMHEDDSKLGATALPTISENNGPQNDTEEGWVCPLCTLINPPNRPGCGACSEARPASYVVPARYRRNDDELIPEELKRFIHDDVRKSSDVQLRNPPKELRNDLNRVSSNRKSSDIFNILLDESKVAESQTRTSQPNPSTTDLLTTRHIQVPEQKNIVMTAFASPNITRNKYRGVDNFNPNSYNNGVAPAPKEGPIISTASPIVRAVLLKERKPVKFERNGLVMPDDDTDVTNHYMELVNLDSADVIANVDAFECPICFSAFEQYEGVVLRDCLHTFCKECLANTINFSEEAEIRCPFMDAVYSCESVITQREIKALVTKDMYEAYLARSIRQAESKLDNTFHCKTPNCRGWCIYEDNVNEFKCPVCTIVNCLTCRAIHDGLDCKQFQDRIKNDCDTNIEARQTRDMLQEMVDRGDALMCPTCQVVMMKKWGCDWLKCSMCKTEICWVTRGPRWGPGGKGDTSAGCRCGVDGKKCHPSCNYCH